MQEPSWQLLCGTRFLIASRDNQALGAQYPSIWAVKSPWPRDFRGRLASPGVIYPLIAVAAWVSAPEKGKRSCKCWYALGDASMNGLKPPTIDAGEVVLLVIWLDADGDRG